VAARRPAVYAKLVLNGDNIHVTAVQEVGCLPVGRQILLLDFEAHDVRIPIAPLYVIDRDRKTPASGMPLGHSLKQIGCKRGNAAFSGQVITEECDGLNAGVCFHNLYPPCTISLPLQ
jgi:hypothetical protein